MFRNARNGEFGNFTEITSKINIRVKMANLTKFRRRMMELQRGVPTKRRIWREWRIRRNFAEERLSSRQGYQRRGDFYEFVKKSEFDEISPKSD